MTLQDRADSYSKAFPKYPPLVVSMGWLYGIWMIGNDYKNKAGYYGEYPPSYLNRIYSVFPDAEEVCHLFSGAVEVGRWGKDSEGCICETTIDLNIYDDLSPQIIEDAHHFSELWDSPPFDLIIADPPYSTEHAKKYGTKMINRNVVTKQCALALKEGGYLVWLDLMLPMYRKKELKLIGTIGLVRSTNHRFRLVSIFERV